MGASWAQAAVGLESDRLRAKTLAHAYMQAMTITPTSPKDRCVRTVSVVARPLRKNRTVSDVARARGVLLSASQAEPRASTVIAWVSSLSHGAVNSQCQAALQARTVHIIGRAALFKR